MNKQQVKGVTNQVTGEVKKEVGKLTGDRSTMARGEAREVKGKLQKNVGDSREVLRRDSDNLDRALDAEDANLRRRDLER